LPRPGVVLVCGGEPGEAACKRAVDVATHLPGRMTGGEPFVQRVEGGTGHCRRQGGQQSGFAVAEFGSEVLGELLRQDVPALAFERAVGTPQRGAVEQDQGEHPALFHGGVVEDQSGGAAGAWAASSVVFGTMRSRRGSLPCASSVRAWAAWSSRSCSPSPNPSPNPAAMSAALTVATALMRCSLCAAKGT
jgi:hypothetical protein